jgi:ATP adenylyltransferase
VTAVPDGYFFSFDKLAYVRGSRPGGCILCLVRDRSPEVEDLSIWRDDLFIVSVNLYPYNPGHLLGLLDRVYAPSGYNIGYNMGRAAGASIGHLHLHIIPRYPHETGIADLIAGRRVLVEDPRRTAETLRRLAAQPPFSSSMS